MAEQAQPASSSQKTNTMAVVGFILAFLMPLAGLVVSIISLGQIKKSNEGGRGLAVAGVVLSSLFTLFWILLFTVIIGGSAAVINEAEKLEEAAEKIEEKAEQNSNLNLEEFYGKIQNGQTKTQVTALAGNDANDCYESQTEGLGKYEYCTWRNGSFDSKYVSVTFHDDVVDSKSKGGF